MSFESIAKSIESVLARHSLSDWHFELKLRYKDKRNREGNFNAILYDAKTGDKTLKLRVRDDEIDRIIYYGADDLERTDDFDDGLLDELEQRKDKDRVGSRLRKRRDRYQHRHADSKDGWNDIDSDALLSDQIDLLIGPAVGQQSQEVQFIMDLVVSDAMESLIGRRLNVERDNKITTLFARKSSKHTFDRAALTDQAVGNE